jgi:hypothetical protein
LVDIGHVHEMGLYQRMYDTFEAAHFFDTPSRAQPTPGPSAQELEHLDAERAARRHAHGSWIEMPGGKRPAPPRGCTDDLANNVISLAGVEHDDQWANDDPWEAAAA